MALVTLSGQGESLANLAAGTPTSASLVPFGEVSGSTLYRTTAGALAGITGLPPVGAFGAVDPTGATDSSATFQAAINSGQSFFVPAGKYLINTGITAETTASNGQYILGAGCPNAAGSGGTTLIAGASVMTLLNINQAGYLLNFGLMHLGFDITACSSGAVAINHGLSFDCFGLNVRVLGAAPSTGKISLQFSPGCYTTQYTNFSGGTVYLNGNGTNDPTTITLNNPDIQQIQGQYFANLTLVGGAVQPPYYAGMTKVYLAANAATTPEGITNSGGIYLILNGYFSNCQSVTVVGTDFEQGGGYPSTYNDGTHGTLNAYPACQFGASLTNATLINPLFAGMYLYPLSSGITYLGANLGGGAPGNTFTAQNVYKALMQLVNGQAFKGYTDNGTTQSFLIDSSTGGATLQYAAIKPATDQTAFMVQNAAGTTLFAVNTVSGALEFLNGGTGFAMYSDNSASNLVFSVNGATGLMRGYNSSVVNTTQMTPANGTFTCTTGYYAGATVAGAVQVVGNRQTGWGAASGTLSRSAYASYAGQTYTGSYVQATNQATDNAVVLLSKTVAALITDLTTHGLIGP